MGVDPVMCPVCTHEETMKARWHDRERDPDDWAVMDYVKFQPRAGGQPVSRWDRGLWECRTCGCRLTPHEALVLLDAVLMHVDPQCDSVEGEPPLHSDARRAGSP